MSGVPCGSGFGVGDAVAVGGGDDGEAVGEDGGEGGGEAGLPSAVAGGGEGAAGVLPAACALQPAVAAATVRTASTAAPARPRFAFREVLLVVLPVISAPCVSGASGVPLDGFPLCPVAKARA